MSIGTEQEKLARGSHCKDLKFYGENLYLSVFICVHLWQKTLKINFTSQKNYQMASCAQYIVIWETFNIILKNNIININIFHTVYPPQLL